MCFGLLDRMAVGCIVLGFATERRGERWSVAAYLAFAIALEVVFQVVASIAISSDHDVPKILPRTYFRLE